MGFNIRDALLKVTRALPNGAATVNSTGLDLGNGPRGEFLAECEVLLTAPALTTGQLPDTKTMTYSIEHDTDSAFGSAATLLPGVIVQTGAGGAGAAGSTFRFALPTNVKRYVRAKSVNSGTGDASGVSLTLEILL